MDRPTRERKQVETINISSEVKSQIVAVGKGTELSKMPQVVTNVSEIFNGGKFAILCYKIYEWYCNQYNIMEYM